MRLDSIYYSEKMSAEICIPKQKYEELLSKAEAYDSIVAEEGLSKEDIARLESAKNSKLLSEKEFKEKYLG